MLRLPLLGFPVALLVFSCGTIHQEREENVPLAYEQKTFSAASAEGCDHGEPCASFEVTYPLFSGLDSAVVDKIEQEIVLRLSMDDPEARNKNLQRLAREFIQDYTVFSREMPDERMGWYYQAYVEVSLLRDTLLSLRLNQEYYTGGAHGGMETSFINIDPRTGATVTLEQFFKPGFEAALAQAGEHYFKNARELSDTATYRNNSIEFPGDQFALNSNYGFGEDGVVFYYNNYEIAPYAAGPTEFVIPYTAMKDWLKN